MPRVRAIQAAAVAQGMRAATGVVDRSIIDAIARHPGQVKAMLEEAEAAAHDRQAKEQRQQQHGG